MTSPVQERIRARTSITENGCWQWTGYIGPNGYVRWSVNGKDQGAHRSSYEAFRGPIPAGLTIDHLCRNRSCMNPDHMECVTQRENVMRSDGLSALASRATHCPKGHAYDENNTLRMPDGGRKCRTCRRALELRRYETRRKARARARGTT